MSHIKPSERAEAFLLKGLLLFQWCTSKALWVKLLCLRVIHLVVPSAPLMRSKLRVHLRWRRYFEWTYAVLKIKIFAYADDNSGFSTLQEERDTRQQRLEVLSKVEKVHNWFCSVRCPFYLFTASSNSHTCSVLQLFIVLLEVEETERMKTTVSTEAEEQRLLEKTQRKIEHIYSQLKHHDPQWVLHIATIWAATGTRCSNPVRRISFSVCRKLLTNKWNLSG